MARQEYKCPACNGMMNFDIKTQKLRCPFCGTIYDISEFSDDIDSEKDKESAKKSDNNTTAEESRNAATSPDNELGINTDAGSEWENGETDKLRVYVCDSCGGEIVGDETLITSKCPYCDSVLVKKENLSGALKPDYVIPFKLEKQQAKEAFAKHLLGKKLVDKKFVDENKIDEIKGVYVPFWLFDVDTDAEVIYKCTDSTSYRSGDYVITETDINNFTTRGSVGFFNIPVDGSSKMADDMMESLEPFDFSEAVPFNTAYLAGYMADKYDVDINASMPNINRRIKGSVADEFKKEVPLHESVKVQSSRVNITGSEAKYALYPVWVLSIVWKNGLYKYMMNGQTGKFVGDILPEDKKKSKKMLLVPTGVLTAIGVVLGALAGMFW